MQTVYPVDIITYLTIQDGQTALEQASIKGHHNVVEFLLGAGANPDLQDKVGTGWDSVVHSNLRNVNGTSWLR